jgi:hypothetical protein
MAFRNDGGNFSNNPLAGNYDALFGSRNLKELDDEDNIPKKAVGMSMGMMGTVNPLTAAESAEAQAGNAINNELNVFGNTKVQPQNIIQNSQPLQAMPLEQPVSNAAQSAPQDSEYFQKLLQMLNK